MGELICISTPAAVVQAAQCLPVESHGALILCVFRVSDIPPGAERLEQVQAHVSLLEQPEPRMILQVEWPMRNGWVIRLALPQPIAAAAAGCDALLLIRGQKPDVEVDAGELAALLAQGSCGVILAQVAGWRKALRRMVESGWLGGRKAQ